MAPQASPHPGKRNVFGINTNRRQSMGAFPSGSPSSNTVASSPQQPTTPAGSGIPSFRALRSLLPFGGPSKNASPTPATASPNAPVTPRASFGFGSVRRSMTKERERKMSLSEAVLPPVLSIERSKSDSHAEGTNIRRSVSLSRLDDPRDTEFMEGSSESAPVLRTPSPGIPLSQELSTIMEADSSGISKHVHISANGSSSPADSRSPSPVMSKRKAAGRDSDGDGDTSMLDLSPTQLTKEVMDAMRSAESPSSSALDWSSTDRAIIIDADGPNDTISLDTSALPAIDAGLAALLSPNSLSKKTTTTTRRATASFLPRLRNSSVSPATSPISPRFPTTPVTPTSASVAATPRPSPSKSRRSLSPSKRSPAPRSPSSPTVSTSTPAPRRSFISNPTHLFTPAASSSLSASTGSKFFGAGIGKGRPPRAVRKGLLSYSPSARTEGDISDNPGGVSPTPPTISLSSPSSPAKAGPIMLARGSLDSRRSPVPSFSETPRRPSLDVPRAPLDGVRRTSFELRRTGTSTSSTSSSSRKKLSTLFLSQPSPSPEPPSMSITIDSSPSPVSPTGTARYIGGGDDDDSPAGFPRRSFESARRSLETSRPSSAALMRERQHQKEKIRGTSDRPATADARLSPAPRTPNTTTTSAPANRTRKRSMSVQDRSVPASRNRYAPANEFGSILSSSRPGSSMSVGYSRRGGGATDRGAGDTTGETIQAPHKPDWLSSRSSARAFKAAGLLEYDSHPHSGDGSDGMSSTDYQHLHHQHHYLPHLHISRERSGSVGHNLSGGSTVLAPSPLGAGGERAGALGRFSSVRGTASEYTTGRTHSRMGFSDAGAGPMSSNRRGSGSFSVYGGGSGGLMESPTFTTSSGSRDRDTPRSAVSTAPTSVSGTSYGPMRGENGSSNRDEVRDLRDKHATEMEALLNALSDSQRTVRLLREENAQLRERAEGEGAEWGRVCAELRRECVVLGRENEGLHRELSGMRSGSVGRRAGEVSAAGQWNPMAALRTPVSKLGGTGVYRHHRQQPLGHGSRLAVPSSDHTASSFARDEDEGGVFNDDEEGDTAHGDIDMHDNTGDDYDPRAHTPPPPQQQQQQQHLQQPLARRLSTASSIFPNLPANMTMLLHEDPDHTSSNRTSLADQFRFPSPNHPHASSSSPPASLGRKTHTRASSIPSHIHASTPPRAIPPSRSSTRGFHDHARRPSVSSAHNVSPTTTANFSMMTGSPGSLFLKPEHEMFLGDMESLDLGLRAEDGRQLGLGEDDDDDGGGGGVDDGW